MPAKTKIKKAKPKGTRDKMPKAKTTLPEIRDEKGLAGKLKDMFTSDKEKQRRAMAKQSTKKSTWT